MIQNRWVLDKNVTVHDGATIGTVATPHDNIAVTPADSHPR